MKWLKFLIPSLFLFISLKSFSVDSSSASGAEEQDISVVLTTQTDFFYNPDTIENVFKNEVYLVLRINKSGRIRVLSVLVSRPLAPEQGENSSLAPPEGDPVTYEVSENPDESERVVPNPDNLDEAQKIIIRVLEDMSMREMDPRLRYRSLCLTTYFTHMEFPESESLAPNIRERCIQFFRERSVPLYYQINNMHEVSLEFIAERVISGLQDLYSGPFFGRD